MTAEVPKPEACPMTILPALISIPPLTELLVDNVNVPVPSLTKEPAPETVPDTVLSVASPALRVLLRTKLPAPLIDLIVSAVLKITVAPELTDSAVESARLVSNWSVPAFTLVAPL